MSGLPFFPPQASTVAGQVDLLMMVLIGLSSFFTLIVVALMVIFSLKYRRGRRADRSNPPTANHRMELGWVAGLLVLGMGTYFWAAKIYFEQRKPPEDPMEFHVVGQQWMWKFQHPTGQQEINTLHVPMGRSIALVMISEDVIHSFYVPAFRMKYDVLPGRYTFFYFNAIQEGEFPIYCAEYCGTLHSKMIGQVVVMAPRNYQAWLAGGQTTAPAANQGETLFTQLGCSACHGAGSGVQAPQLAGVFGQPVPLADGQTVVADENYLRESILEPQAKIVAGYQPIMPTYQGRISEEQLLQVISYIKSLGDGASNNGTNPAGGDNAAGGNGTGAGGTSP